MLDVTIIKHSDIQEEILLSICQIKSMAWPYDIEDHRKWIGGNLLNDDIHVLLHNNGIIVAYLNLVNIRFLLNKKLVHGIGIGNVCASERGSGYGSKIVQVATNYIQSHELIGLLFCRKELTSFYTKNKWIIVSHSNITLLNVKDVTFETMVFNANLEIESIEYSDRLF